jgi:hypothetical protein
VRLSAVLLFLIYFIHFLVISFFFTSSLLAPLHLFVFLPPLHAPFPSISLSLTPSLLHFPNPALSYNPQVLLELKEYATEVDVDFVRKVRTLNTCISLLI